MQAVAHSPKFAKKVGVPQSVGREFTKFGGGAVKKDSKAMAKKEIAFMQKKGAPKSMIKHEKEEYGMKKGGKGYAMGGNLNVKRPPASVLRGIGMKDVIDNPRVSAPTGGMTPKDYMRTMADRLKDVKTPAPTPRNPATRSMAPASGRGMGMKSGGLTAGHKSADGVAKKGKTRAMQPKMAGSKKMMGGGKC